MMMEMLAGCHFLSITLLSYRCFPDGSGPLGAVLGPSHPPKLYEAEGVQRAEAEAGLCFCRSARTLKSAKRSGLRLQHGEGATFDPTQFGVHSSQLQLQRSWPPPVLPHPCTGGCTRPLSAGSPCPLNNVREFSCVQAAKDVAGPGPQARGCVTASGEQLLLCESASWKRNRDFTFRFFCHF